MRKDFEPHGLESRTEDGGTTEPLSARDGGEEDRNHGGKSRRKLATG